MDANRTGKFFKCGSRQMAGCTHDWPICVIVADVVVRNAPAAATVACVDRHFDCLMCCPFVDRFTITKASGQFLRRGTVFDYGMENGR